MSAEATDLTIREPQWVAPAVPLPITTAEDYTVVAERLKDVKGFTKQVEAWFAPLVEKAHASWKSLTERRRETLAPAVAFEAECKAALSDYDQKQEELRQAEERRLATLARAAEEQRRLEEAAALEAEGIAEGDEGKLAESRELIETPIETPVVMVEKQTPKVAGISYREQWKARVTDLHKLIQYVADHPEYVNWLTPNLVALGQQARSLQGNMRIPGVQAYAERIVGARP